MHQVQKIVSILSCIHKYYKLRGSASSARSQASSINAASLGKEKNFRGLFFDIQKKILIVAANKQQSATSKSLKKWISPSPKPRSAKRSPNQVVHRVSLTLYFYQTPRIRVEFECASNREQRAAMSSHHQAAKSSVGLKDVLYSINRKNIVRIEDGVY